MWWFKTVQPYSNLDQKGKEGKGSIYVVTSNLLIILSFRLNLETESLFHKLKARGPIRHPLFRYSCQHSRLGYTGLALVSDQTTW
jgi:hypothetical protein